MTVNFSIKNLTNIPIMEENCKIDGTIIYIQFSCFTIFIFIFNKPIVYYNKVIDLKLASRAFSSW